MQGIDYWRLADELSIVQATLLIIGIDPSGKEHDLERKASKPEGYDAIKHSLITSLQNNGLKGTKKNYQDTQCDQEYIDVHESRVTVESLREWLQAKGVRRHFFFFPEEPEGKFLSETHPRYSPKLAAAVRSWLALEDKVLHEKTPKQSVIVWLRKHSVKYGLNDKDGKLKEGTIEEIAKIVNWNPKGGAPSTPCGASSEEAVVNSIKENTSDELFSVLKENKYGENPSDLDSEVPF